MPNPMSGSLGGGVCFILQHSPPAMPGAVSGGSTGCQRSLLKYSVQE